MTTRHSFMAGILAAATPPGFVRAGVLMPVAPLIVTPALAFDMLQGKLIMSDAQLTARLDDLEAQARRQFADWAARRNASILDQYLTGSYKQGFR